MRFQQWKQWKSGTALPLYLKSGAILLLFTLSVLIVACGNNGTDTSLGNPAVTVTINLDGSDGSPTPPLPDYSCNAWATNTTPGINTSVLGVYAKFTHNVNGNPEGVGGATATATVLWPEGATNVTATTTSDGLAVFPVSVAGRVGDMNKLIEVTVSFQKAGVPDCNVGTDRAAFFTLVAASASPTPSVTASPSATPNGQPTDTATPTDQPTVTPSPIGLPTLTPCPTRTFKKTPTPCR